MYEIFHEEICIACNGSGTQINTKTGLTVLCPVCNGRGKKYISNMEGLPPGTYCYD